MIPFRRILLLNLYMFADICILIASLFIASWFVTYRDDIFTLREFFFKRFSIGDFMGFLSMIVLWHVTFRSYKLYNSRRLDCQYWEGKDIIKATSLGMGIFALLGIFFDILTPQFIAVAWLSSTIINIVFRSLLRSVLKRLRMKGKNLRLVLIIGTNQRAYDFAHLIEEKKELGYRLIGFLDNTKHLSNEKVKLLGSLKDFNTILKDQVIDEIVVTLPIKSCYDKIETILQQAEEQGITVRYLSTFFNTNISRVREEKFEDFLVMTLFSTPQDSWGYLAKRVLDFSAGLILAVLMFPLMMFVALAIKLDSPGSVLFVQKRVGQNKRIFRLYKFRTMRTDAEDMQMNLENLNEMDGPVFKIRNDPRITKVGWWLRKLSIDELPQIINVIKGDMSLVGPRPLPIRDYKGFNKDWQRKRFSIRPGITCTWQIQGRNDISFEEWMKLDLEYVNNWKFIHDVEILLKTIPAVIKGRGAA